MQQQPRMNFSQDVVKRIAVMIQERVFYGINQDYYLEQKTQTGYLENKYTLKAKIGSGSYGHVYKAVEKEAKEEEREVAVKQMKVEYEQDYSDKKMKQTSTEDRKRLSKFMMNAQETVLQSDVFDHINVVKVHDKWIQDIDRGNKCDLSANVPVIIEHLQSGEIVLTDELRTALVGTSGLQFYMMMDLYEMDMNEWLKEREIDENTNEVAEAMLLNIADGLNHVHSHKYIHNDLKPGNILIKVTNGQPQAALADFGRANKITEKVEQVPEDEWYRSGTMPYNGAPDKIYSTAFDMWSVGLMAYQLGVHKLRLTDNDESEQKLKDLAKKAKQGDVLEFVKASVTSKTICEAIAECLKHDSAGRCTASQLVDMLRPSELPVVV